MFLFLLCLCAAVSHWGWRIMQCLLKPIAGIFHHLLASLLKVESTSITNTPLLQA